MKCIQTPSQVLDYNKYLSKLKINCDHASRGCPQLTCLEDLKTHVATCGYAPVLCSNAECRMEINKQDKVRHETEVCEYRRVKCHNCRQIQKDIKTLKKSLSELDWKVEATNKKMKNNHAEMKEVVRNLQDQIEQDQQQVKKEVKDAKESFSKVNKDVDEVKVMMIQVLEKLNMREQHYKVSSPTAGIMNTPREDILVARGSANASIVDVYYSSC